MPRWFLREGPPSLAVDDFCLLQGWRPCPLKSKPRTDRVVVVADLPTADTAADRTAAYALQDAIAPHARAREREVLCAWLVRVSKARPCRC